MAWFPTDITYSVLTSVTLVRRRLQENPNAFDDPECAYGPEIREWFAKDSGAGGVQAIAAAIGEIQGLESEARELYGLLKGQKESIAYVKVGTQLLEKLIDCQERAAGIAEIEQFKRVVLEIMGDIMTPEQRTQFMDRLKAVE
jgi:hypothetical protein